MSKSEPQNNDWNNLSNLWQEAPTQDIGEVVKKIRAKTFRMKIIFGFETLAAIAGILLGLYVMFIKPEMVNRVSGAVASFLCLGALYFNWWVRKDIWKAASSSQYDQFHLMYKRAKASITYAKFNLWGSGFVVAFFIGFYVFGWEQLLEVDENKRAQFDLLMIFVSLYVAVLTIGLIIYLRKKNRELNTYTNILKDMDEDRKDIDAS